MTRSDEARSVRDEDAFDVAVINAWLKERVDGLSGYPEVRQFPGGASNLTYLLKYPDRELVLRRPPGGTKAKSAHDMRREYTIQSRLKPVFRYVPHMLALCTDDSVIGSDFYVMERVAGLILRKDLPSGLDLPPDEARRLCHNLLDRLVELHSIDPAAAGLAEISKGQGYVRRQVAGWSDRYRRARTWNVPSYQKVMAWLDERQPEDVRNCVIHNDFRFDNVVLDPDDLHHVRGILDWEMATLGDPLMDLGGALAYWIEAGDGWLAGALRRQPTHLPGMLTRREVVAYYCERAGLPSDNWAFYEVFGLFRLAVIAQQIYYRYFHKQTTNPAFRNLWIAVHHLHGRASRLIRAS